MLESLIPGIVLGFLLWILMWFVEVVLILILPFEWAEITTMGVALFLLAVITVNFGLGVAAVATGFLFGIAWLTRRTVV